MRYTTKITALLLAVSVLPVAASGLISSSLSTRTVASETLRLQRELARQVAAQLDGWVGTVLRDLQRSSSYLPLDRLAGDELSAVLRVPYRQLEYATAVLLLDDEARPVARPAYLARGQPTRDLPADVRARPRLGPADLARVERQLPLAAVLQRGAGCGAPYVDTEGAAQLVCAVAVAGPTDSTSGRGKTWVLAAAASLAPLRRLLETAARFGGKLYLTDARSRLIVASGGLRPGQRVPHLARSGPVSAAGVVERYRDGSGEPVFAAAASVPALGATLWLEQAEARALGPARRLLLYTGLWTALCLVAAVGGGVFLSRGVTRPVQRLAAAARSIQDGDLEQDVLVEGQDELGQLAGAFNGMAAAVKRSFQVISEQRDELQRWNVELQQRVEERTREVEEALEQVIRSQKMGALGELSAGVAHELNNPLASIVLAAQLAQRLLPEGSANRENLRTVIEQAGRMHDIVQRLLRFAETPEGVPRKAVHVGELIQEALMLARVALEEAGVAVRLDLADDLAPISGSADELQQALLHLIHNAIRAMPAGGALTIETREVKEAVRIAVRDTGRGIEPAQLERVFEPFFAADKPRHRGAGLGLSVVDRVVREHAGRITVRSTLGEGTTFNLYFPGIRQGTHLSAT